MLITNEQKLEFVAKFKRYSSMISELEIAAWETYDYNKAYESFWPNQYLKLYIQVLEDSVLEDVTLSEKDINHIVESAKEIIFYTLKIEL